MEIPGLGPVVLDDDLGWYVSEPLPVPVFGGALCQITIDGYDDDRAPAEIHAAIQAFLSLDASALRVATPWVFAYYRDALADLDEDEEGYVEIPHADDVWDHVDAGAEVIVGRSDFDDPAVYVSIECDCTWEPEHGLQIVFRDGRTICKVGPYDGHMTNAHAYDRDDLDSVIYVGTSRNYTAS